MRGADVAGPQSVRWPLAVRDLGTVEYRDAWELQRTLVGRRTAGKIPDTILLLEHPHTITCGRAGGRENVLAPDEELARRGVTLVDVDRGGDVTYHGPAQLVAYPILSLTEAPFGRDVHAYVRALEQVLIGTLASFAISAYRVTGLSGAWVELRGLEAKIAALGVKVDGRGITSHGIALNVAPNMAFFNLIVPCGITGRGVTSMQELLAEAPSMVAVKREFTLHFADIFQRAVFGVDALHAHSLAPVHGASL